MNLIQAVGQMNDLPATFKQVDATYPQLVASVAVGLAAYTDTADEIGAEATSITSAQYGWLDVWGLLFGIQRNAGEADFLYRSRIQNTLFAWVGTRPAIIEWGTLILNQTITLTEKSGGGFTIVFPASLSADAISSFVASLNRIRPAGVPFQVAVQSTGLYLDTINYLDCAAVTGAYLIDSLTYLPLSIGAETANAVPILPSFYLNDPTLNPGL
jgi:hypothetical protein